MNLYEDTNKDTNKYTNKDENEYNDYYRYKPIKIDYPAFIDSTKNNDTSVSSPRIGILIYGSLYKNPGILSSLLEKDKYTEIYYQGPTLSVNLSGYNRFNNNLTRVIDYKNGNLIHTVIRVFKKTIGVQEAKRYIVLREGNINYLVYYVLKNDILINIPNHLYSKKDEIIMKMRESAKKLNLDYIFFQAYPVMINNIKSCLKDNPEYIENTIKYIKKCDPHTLLDVEKDILRLNF